MVDDFNIFYSKANESCKIEAFEEYYSKYSEIFNLMIENLYLTDFETFIKILENTDLNNIYNIINSLNENIIPQISTIANTSVNFLNFNSNFDLYIGVGLGHVCGCSLPYDKPFIYFGLETFRNVDLQLLIPHEINHMIRINSIDNIDLNVFGERVVSEGLGLISSLIINRLPINNINVSKLLNISENDLEKLELNKDSIYLEVTSKFNENIDQELMNTYFNLSNLNDSITCKGYYVGIKIIKNALNSGYNLNQLTKLKLSSFQSFL